MAQPSAEPLTISPQSAAHVPQALETALAAPTRSPSKEARAAVRAALIEAFEAAPLATSDGRPTALGLAIADYLSAHFQADEGLGVRAARAFQKSGLGGMLAPHLQEVARRRPQSVPVRAALADELLAHGETADALARVEEGLALEPDAQPLARKRAQLLLTLGRLEESHAAAEADLQRCDLSDARTLRWQVDHGAALAEALFARSPAEREAAFSLARSRLALPLEAARLAPLARWHAVATLAEGRRRFDESAREDALAFVAEGLAIAPPGEPTLRRFVDRTIAALEARRAGEGTDAALQAARSELAYAEAVRAAGPPIPTVVLGTWYADTILAHIQEPSAGRDLCAALDTLGHAASLERPAGTVAAALAERTIADVVDADAAGCAAVAATGETLARYRGAAPALYRLHRHFVELAVARLDAHAAAGRWGEAFALYDRALGLVAISGEAERFCQTLARRFVQAMASGAETLVALGREGDALALVDAVREHEPREAPGVHHAATPALDAILRSAVAAAVADVEATAADPGAGLDRAERALSALAASPSAARIDGLTAPLLRVYGARVLASAADQHRTDRAAALALLKRAAEYESPNETAARAYVDRRVDDLRALAAPTGRDAAIATAADDLEFARTLAEHGRSVPIHPLASEVAALVIAEAEAAVRAGDRAGAHAAVDATLVRLRELEAAARARAALARWLVADACDAVRGDGLAFPEALALGKATLDRLRAPDTLLHSPPLVQAIIERAGDAFAAGLKVEGAGAVRLFGETAAIVERGLDPARERKALVRRLTPVAVEAAESAFEAGRHADALAIFERAASFVPDDSTLVTRHALKLFELNRSDEADALWQDFIARHPGSAAAGTFASNLLFRQRQADALAVLQRADRAADLRTRGELAEITVKAYIESDDAAGARAHLAALADAGGAPFEDQLGAAWVLLSENRPREALVLASRLSEVGTSPRVRDVAARLAARCETSLKTGDILARVPLPQPLRGVVVLVSLGSSLSLVWKGMTATELRRRGWATVVLEREASVELPPTGEPAIDGLQGLVATSGKALIREPARDGLRHEWTIAPERGVIEACGINFNESVRERIRTVMRRYTVDLAHPRAREVLDDAILRADAALAVCRRIHETLADRGVPVRFLGSMSHYIPSAVYKAYCSAHRHDTDMSYVAYLAAYQHYYSNFGNTVSTALSVNNLTLNDDLRMPILPTAHDFEAWERRLDDPRSILEGVDKIIAFDRAGLDRSAEAQALTERVLAHRERGGKVLVLFGKVPYDAAVDVEGGPAHEDMVDWVRHSIACVAGREDLMLLIKPHPNEFKQEVATPSEYFLDLCGETMPDNVVKLDHRWFNVNELLPITDMGLMWHGTATLEMMAKGVPIVVASHTGITDFPLKVLAPRDRAHYEALIGAPAAHEVDEATRRRCALLISYMGSTEMMIPYDYGVMPFLRRIQVGPVKWFEDRVERYFREGDPHVAVMAERAVTGRTSEDFARAIASAAAEPRALPPEGGREGTSAASMLAVGTVPAGTVDGTG